MAFYREIEGDITRDYTLLGNVESFRTRKALLEIVPSKAFQEMVFLDGELQFTKKDEYIYHEMLVHPAMSTQANPTSVCILGGGDGCALREVLKFDSVETIDLFDYDDELVNLFRTDFSYLNQQSLSNPKVHIHIQNVNELPVKEYDVVIVDLTDPKFEDREVRNLWNEFLPKLPLLLKPTSSLVLNAGGISKNQNQTINWLLFRLSEYFQQNTTHTLEAYKVFVPSFASEWCFFLLRPEESYFRLSMYQDSHRTRYFDERIFAASLKWPKDIEANIPFERVKLNGYLPPL